MLMPSIFGETLFDDFFEDFAKPNKKLVRMNVPAPAVMKTDIKELEDGFELHIDLPGYKKEDVLAELKDGYLTITASRKTEENQEEKGKYIRRERYFGSSSRSFYVGEVVQQEDVKAKFNDGILTITIPKKEAKPAVEENRYITIEG